MIYWPVWNHRTADLSSEARLVQLRTIVVHGLKGDPSPGRAVRVIGVLEILFNDTKKSHFGSLHAILPGRPPGNTKAP